MTMKHPPNTKLRRNLDILKVKRLNPNLTLAQIAAMFDVSRQCVHQILKRGF